MRSATPLVALALALMAAPVHAEQPDGYDDPFDFGPVPGWSVLVGPHFGASFGSDGAGGFVGGEISVNRLSQGTWVGLFVDGGYDFGRSETLVTAGPQFGVAVLGFEAGIGVRFEDGETDFGPQGRLLVALPFFSIFGRYGYFVDSKDHLGQVGLMFKLPVWSSSTGEFE